MSAISSSFQTESVCPICLERLPAERVICNQDVYLKKTCPTHGSFRTILWRGEPAFSGWVRPKTAAFPANPQTNTTRGCPYDCGLCADHRQATCCVLFEVTQRCDLACPVCYAAAPTHTPDPSLETIAGWYQILLDAGGPYNIQLSGGEPCLRNDLPAIIALGREMGFHFFQLNTNGLRIGADPDYLDALIQAGLSTIFLQFDTLSDAVYTRLRGRPLLERKLAAVEQILSRDLGVMLVPTLAPGLNTPEIGALIDFALSRAPGVRGVHFQPLSYFGRYPLEPQDANRITLPEVMSAIHDQTGGRIGIESFRPPGGENALCSFHANFVIMPDGELKPTTRHNPAGACCSQPEDGAQGSARSRQFVAKSWTAPAAPALISPELTSVPIADLSTTDSSPQKPTVNFGGWDVFLSRLKTHTFCLSGMAFQDAWNLDLERLKDCYIHVMSPDGRLVPFCAYNLTNANGESLYRGRPVIP